jgi:4-diphosphocytidyl-2-C-methyl-D-erythritol kinase
VLITRAPGKLNLCLLVGAARADGLHDLVSLVQPVTLADTVTLADLKGPGPFRLDEVVCPGVEGENLAARALAEFRAATGWDAPPQRLNIDKQIPVAAGMGGGSSDAAAALRLAAAASGLAVPDDLAMRLGADVPVLLTPSRALMTGAGERVEPLPFAERPAILVVVPLDAALGAGEVYRAFDALGRARSAHELEKAAGHLRSGGPPPPVNDLEPAARALCPGIDAALDALHDVRVQHPMVTGSGPTVFGTTEDPEAVERLRAAGYARAVAVAPAGPEHAEVRRA